MKNSPVEGLTLRRARQGDAAQIWAIERAYPTSGGWTERQLSEEAGRPDAVFAVATKDARVVAYVVGRVEASQFRIYTVGVDPALARRGAARSTLAFALGLAREAGCAKASLEVSQKNERAQAFYAAAGFAIVGRRPKFYNDGSDALLMDLAL